MFLRLFVIIGTPLPYSGRMVDPLRVLVFNPGLAHPAALSFAPYNHTRTYRAVIRVTRVCRGATANCIQCSDSSNRASHLALEETHAQKTAVGVARMERIILLSRYTL